MNYIEQCFVTETIGTHDTVIADASCFDPIDPDRCSMFPDEGRPIAINFGGQIPISGYSSGVDLVNVWDQCKGGDPDASLESWSDVLAYTQGRVNDLRVKQNVAAGSPRRARRFSR